MLVASTFKCGKEQREFLQAVPTVVGKLTEVTRTEKKQEISLTEGTKEVYEFGFFEFE